MSSVRLESFPPEMKGPVSELHESLADLRQTLIAFNDNYNQIKSRTSDPLLKAKLELTNAYAINSLFWIYLTTKGVNPREHPIKQEISRLKGYAERVQAIEDKHKANKLDTNAVKRFIRSALWEPKKDPEVSSTKTDMVSNKRKLSDNWVEESKQSMDLIHNYSSDEKRHKKFKK